MFRRWTWTQLLYDIFCKCYFRSPIKRWKFSNFATLRCRFEVYMLSLKSERSSRTFRGCFITCWIRDHSHSTIWKCPTSSHLWPHSGQVDFEASHFHLLQAHFPRLQLLPDLAVDQVLVLKKVLIKPVTDANSFPLPRFPNGRRKSLRSSLSIGAKQAVPHSIWNRRAYLVVCAHGNWKGIFFFVLNFPTR
jgi:hypothetical protein